MQSFQTPHRHSFLERHSSLLLFFITLCNHELYYHFIVPANNFHPNGLDIINLRNVHFITNVDIAICFMMIVIFGCVDDHSITILNFHSRCFLTVPVRFASCMHPAIVIAPSFFTPLRWIFCSQSFSFPSNFQISISSFYDLYDQMIHPNFYCRAYCRTLIRLEM